MSFQLDMDKFIAKYERRAHEVQRDAASKVARDLIDETPEDTGYAAANWQAGIGHVPKELVNRTDSAKAKAEALAKIALWPQGTTLVLANSVPYIFSLEFGDRYHSPASMVGKVRTRWDRFVHEAADKI